MVARLGRFRGRTYTWAGPIEDSLNGGGVFRWPNLVSNCTRPHLKRNSVSSDQSGSSCVVRVKLLPRWTVVWWWSLCVDTKVSVPRHSVGTIFCRHEKKYRHTVNELNEYEVISSIILLNYFVLDPPIYNHISFHSKSPSQVFIRRCFDGYNLPELWF